MRLVKANAVTARSDQVRQRRDQVSQERVKKTTSYVRRPSRQSNVFVRNGRGGTPVINRTRTPVKRKYAITLDRGTEMLLPAVPVIHFGWRLLSGLIVVLMIAGIIVMTNMGEFTVSAPQIDGIQRLNLTDVETVVDMNGQSVLAANPIKIRDELAKAFPELTDISIRVSLPASIVISAVERQPMLSWQYNGKTLWIDASGAIFPARGDAGTLLTIKSDSMPPVLAASSPTATATKTPTAQSKDSMSESDIYHQVADPQMLLAALKLSQVLPQNTILVHSTNNGLGWSDPQGWKVYVGNDLSNLDAELAEYQTIVEELKKKGIKPAVISVENIYAPYYRLEQ